VNGDVGVEVGIERLDDVSFESGGSALELLQAKHHIDRVASLSDKSADLWKTLRVWSEAAAKDPTLPARTRLALVTTGSAPAESAASLLRPAGAYAAGHGRDPKAAAALLETVADAGGNLVAHVRMDGAWLGSVDISIKKAYTSRAFDIATQDLATHSQSGGQFFGIHASNDGKIMIFAGGIPLKSDGKVVGAVGVSGGSGDQDHAVAEAGAAAF